MNPGDAKGDPLKVLNEVASIEPFIVTCAQLQLCLMSPYVCHQSVTQNLHAQPEIVNLNSLSMVVSDNVINDTQTTQAGLVLRQ